MFSKKILDFIKAHFVFLVFILFSVIFSWSIYQELIGSQIFSNVDFNKGEKIEVPAGKETLLPFSQKTDCLVGLHIPFYSDEELWSSDFDININNDEKLIYGKRIDKVNENSAILVLSFPKNTEIKSLNITAKKNVTYIFNGNKTQNKQYGLQTKYRFLLCAGFIVLCLLICLVFFLIDKFIKAFALRYFLYAIIVGLACICVWPAFLNEDERTHFNTANFYANIFTGIQKYEDISARPYADVKLRKCDNLLYPSEISNDPKFGGSLKDIWQSKDVKKYYAYAFPRILKANSSNDYVTIKSNLIDAQRILYFIPHIAGVLICRAMNTNQFILYYFCGFLSLLFSAGVITFAFAKTKCKSILFYFLALNPGLLRLMSHFTYDGAIFSFNIAFFIFFFSYYERRKLSDLVLSIIFLILLYPAKQHIYMIFGLLYLFLPTKQIKAWFANKKAFYSSLCVFFIIIIATYLKLAIGGSDSYYPLIRTNGDYAIVHTLTYVLLHPFDDLLRFLYTVWTQFGKLFEQAFGLMVGIRYFTATSFVQIFFFIILYLSVIDKTNYVLTKKQKGLTTFIIIFLSLLIFFGMFVGYGDNIYIRGIQGRYFIPLLPLIFMSLPEKLKLGKEHENSSVLQLAIPVYGVIAFMDMFMLIIR